MTKSKKWTKALGAVGKVIAVLPDTTEIIGRAIDNTRPIIENELKRHHDHSDSLIELDNVVHLDIKDAKKLLENQGFVVREILENPQVKYATLTANQVIKVHPRTKRAKIGSLVKLYYLDQRAINASAIIETQKREKSEQLTKKVAESLTGAKSFFDRKEKTRKDVTPK